MGTRLPFAIEIVFLVLVLPIAFAYLASVAGVAALCVRTTLRKYIFRGPAPRSKGLRPRR